MAQTYTGWLREQLSQATDPGERAWLEEQLDHARADAEFQNAGHRERITGERLLRERYGGPP
jgi:hypothetical protein